MGDIRIEAARLVNQGALRGVVTITAGPVRIDGCTVTWAEDGAQLLYMPKAGGRRAGVTFRERADYHEAARAAVAALDALEGLRPEGEGEDAARP